MADVSSFPPSIIQRVAVAARVENELQTVSGNHPKPEYRQLTEIHIRFVREYSRLLKAWVSTVLVRITFFHRPDEATSVRIWQLLV